MPNGTQQNKISLLPDEKLNFVNENLQLIQKKNGLTYGTDAYLLSAFVKERRALRGADLGSGTGIISLLCAKREKLGHIFAIELQESFAHLIEKNATLNNLTESISVICKDIRKLSAKDTEGELDVVISNPPYMRVGAGKKNEAEEKYIARHEVFGSIGDFCRCANRLLKFGGSFYCVYRPDRLTDLIISLRENHLEPKRAVFVCATSDTPPSMVLLEARKGGLPSMKTELLILREKDENGNLVSTKAAEKIYASCSFYLP